MARRIKEFNSRIVIYGAGMIGQIVVPYMIEKYCLQEYVDCFVDLDRRKQERRIKIGDEKVKVFSPDILREIDDRFVLLITNSNFYPVIEFLDNLQNLEQTEVYIIPIMQIYELRSAKAPCITRITEMPVIPKKIHYCWFSGRSMPEFLQDCVKTWKKLCPDYEVICWSEDNYDVKRIPYAKEAYEQQRYGFVTDAARLDLLNQYGGIYMDTDVTMLRNLDELLYQPAFVGVEKWGNINTGGCVGAVPGHPMIKEMLEYRSRFHFLLEDGSLNTETNGIYETIPLLKYGMRIDNSMQIVNGMTVYPSSVFHPYDYMSEEESIEEWTFCKHHFYGGWMGKSVLNERRNTQKKYQKILKRIEEFGEWT